MELRWSPRAIRDLQQIRLYISEHDPKAAQKVAKTIKHTVHLLLEYPQLGVQTRVEGVYEKQVPNLPFLIPYRLRNDVIEILAVFDTRQIKPEGWV